MGRFDFVSPGAAAGDALRKLLIEREAQQRQDMLDQLAQARESRLVQSDADQHQVALATLANTQANTASQIAARKATEAEQQRTNDEQAAKTAIAPLRMGDDVSDETYATATKVPGMAGYFNPGAVTQGAQTGTDENDVPQYEVKQGHKFAGSPEERKIADTRQKVEETLKRHPELRKDPDMANLIDIASATDKWEPVLNAQSKLIEDRPPETFRTSPDRKTLERWDGTQFVPFVGQIPKNHVMLQAPQPSNSADPTWGSLTAPDGTIYRFNTKDPNAVLIPQKMPDGTNVHHVTAQTQAMMEGATMLAPHIVEVDKLAADLDKAGQFGPFASRMREIMTKYGDINPMSPDSELKLQQLGAAIDSDPILNQNELAGRFASELSLLASGAGRVHGGARGGGSIQMIDYLKSMLSASSNYAMFHGRLSGLKSYIDGYAKGPKGSGNSSTTTGGTEKQPAGGGPRVRTWTPGGLVD